MMRRKSKTKIVILLIVLIIAVISLLYVLKFLPQADITSLPGFTWQTYPLEGYRPIASTPSSGAGGVSP